MNFTQLEQIRKKSAKMLEMEELGGEFGLLSQRDAPSRFELSWTDAGLEDGDYSQLLREEDMDVEEQVLGGPKFSIWPFSCLFDALQISFSL